MTQINECRGMKCYASSQQSGATYAYLSLPPRALAGAGLSFSVGGTHGGYADKESRTGKGVRPAFIRMLCAI